MAERENLSVTNLYVKDIKDPTGKTTIFSAGSSGLIQESKLNLYKLGGAAASASGELMGVGTSSAPATSSTAESKLVEIRGKTTATTGDNRLMYLRYSASGINAVSGASQDCLRAFAKVEASVSNSNGAHISLDLGASGVVTGLGVGVNGQLALPDATVTGGTYAALQSEIYVGGDATDPSAVTELSFLRFSLGGSSATGVGAVEDKSYLMVLEGVTAASGNMVGANTAGATTLTFTNWVPIKIKIDGVEHFMVAARTVAATS